MIQYEIKLGLFRMEAINHERCSGDNVERKPKLSKTTKNYREPSNKKTSRNWITFT